MSKEFSLSLSVVRSEIDELGHASNVAYVRWVQEVAKAHSAAVGFDHAAYVAVGGVFVVRKHEIEYLAPALEGDELRLITWIESWTAVTSERRTRVERGGQVLARCTTTWAFVGLEGKPRRIPAEVRAAFG